MKVTKWMNFFQTESMLHDSGLPVSEEDAKIFRHIPLYASPHTIIFSLPDPVWTFHLISHPWIILSACPQQFCGLIWMDWNAWWPNQIYVNQLEHRIYRLCPNSIPQAQTTSWYICVWLFGKNHICFFFQYSFCIFWLMLKVTIKSISSQWE